MRGSNSHVQSGVFVEHELTVHVCMHTLTLNFACVQI